MNLTNDTLLHFKEESYIIVEITPDFYHCNLTDASKKRVIDSTASFNRQHLQKLIDTGVVKLLNSDNVTEIVTNE
jgi:hypothetical protein